LAPGTETERDREQVRLAIEGVRALMPLLEQSAPSQAAPVRDALSQLQLAFVRIGGQAGATEAPSSEQPSGEPPRRPAAQPQAESPAEQGKPGEPGPAQRSGRLWVPGQ
jgi:hypothetical protein